MFTNLLEANPFDYVDIFRHIDPLLTSSVSAAAYRYSYP